MTLTARRPAAAALGAALLTAFLATPVAADTPAPTCEGGVCRLDLPTQVQDPQEVVVPDGVTGMTVELAGAQGDPRAGHVGGPGGAVHASFAVTPGETLTLQVPRWAWDRVPKVVDRYNGQNVNHQGADGAYVFRGSGASATPLVVVGGGGQAGTAGDGGAGGGWHADAAQRLRGQDGTGPGAGRGATPTGAGRAWSGASVHAGAAGGGPVRVPGEWGLGGNNQQHHYVVRDGGWESNRYVHGSDGGHGYYGGASGAFTADETVGGAGGGSGYAAPGVVLQAPSETTLEAARTYAGRVALVWREPVAFAPVVEVDGRVVDGVLPSRTFDVVASGLLPGARVAVTARPGDGPTVRGTVGKDGAIRLGYELPGTLRGETWLDVGLTYDGRALAGARVDLHLPEAGSTTELTVPAQVAAGGAVTVDVAHTVHWFGEDEPGASPAAVAALLRSGAVRLVVDGTPLAPEALTLPADDDLPASGALPVTFDAPADTGEREVTLEVVEPGDLVTTTRTFTVVAAAPTATPAPTATATPSAGAVATERAEVLAADDDTRSGVLAATGAQVLVVALVAVAAIAAGALLYVTRGRRSSGAPSRRVR